MEEIKKGNTYQAEVKGVAAGGLIVAIPGTAATSLIAVKELALPFGKQEHLSHFRRGHKVKVRVLDIIREQRITGQAENVRYVMSLRLAEHDPWENINTALHWEPGLKKPYSLQVDRITAEYARGELLPGVTAEVTLKELDRFFKSRTETIKTNMELLPKIGDFLAGYIKEVLPQQRLVLLDVVAYIKDIKKRVNLIKINEQEPKPPAVIIETVYETNKSHTIQNILIVDDEKAFCTTLSQLLTDAGYTLFVAYDVITAQSLLNQQTIHLVLLDIQIPSQNESFQLMQFLAKNYQGVKIILTTGDENFPHHRDTSAINPIPINNFLLKPFSSRELKELIAGIDQTPAVPFSQYFHTADSVDEPPVATDTRASDSFIPHHANVRELFEKILNETKAGNGAIFEIHPLTLEVFMPHWENIDIPHFNQLRARLAMSPVRDCAIDKKIIYSNTAHHEEEKGKHHYLVKLVDYEAVILVPIVTRDELQRCLFLSNRGLPFTLEDRHKAEKIAMELASLYSEESHLQRAITEKTEANTGLNYAVLGHELKSKLVVMEAMLSNIRRKVVQDMYPQKQLLLHDLDELEQTNQRVLGITTLFRGLGVKEAPTTLKIEILLQKVIADIEKYAVEELYTVKIVFTEPVPPLPTVYMQEKELYQLFFNLLLNALQYSKLFLDPPVIQILINGETIKIANQEAIVIDFHDWGPGVHAKDFTRIFEPMFTTRQEGAGLGLYLCKRLLAENRGDIFVLKSYLYVGTTFRIRLPIKGAGNGQY